MPRGGRRIRPISHEDRLSVVEHLGELRMRLFVSLAAFAAAFSITAWQNHAVLDIVNRPLPDGVEPITLGPAEPFYTTITNSAYAALLIALLACTLAPPVVPAAHLPGTTVCSDDHDNDGDGTDSACHVAG